MAATCAKCRSHFPLSEPVKERLKNKAERHRDLRRAAGVEGQRFAGRRRPRAGEQHRAACACARSRKSGASCCSTGAPRWETRYLRNMFERDEQWEVNAVIAGRRRRARAAAARRQGRAISRTIRRCSQPYDLIIFGEVPRALFKDEELQWIARFRRRTAAARWSSSTARGSA